jgi:hypothetical protein
MASVTHSQERQGLLYTRPNTLLRTGQSACKGYCYPHVQAIIVSIDQYAEAALGNRNYFLNRPYGIGGRKSGDVP